MTMTALADDSPDCNGASGSAPRCSSPGSISVPALVLIVTVLLVPLIIGISYSFRKFSAFRSEFVGLGQYRPCSPITVLHGRRSINTLWWTVGSLFFQFFLGLGLALLLNRPFVGQKLVQALVFLPWAVPIFPDRPHLGMAVQPDHRAVAACLLRARPARPSRSPSSSDPATAMWGPIIANVWFGIPFFAITLLAARNPSRPNS